MKWERGERREEREKASPTQKVHRVKALI